MQALQPSSPGNQASYHANVYPNGNSPHDPIPGAQSDISSSYSPPKYAVVINTLWFLSLSISLTCALLATLQQQWARRYIMITHKRHHPRNRARIRSFFAEGVDKLHLPLAVDVLPTLLHSSLFLFFAGLVVFLYHINSTVFIIVAVWVGICTFVYACITLLPIFRHDSPYYTPLSSLAWFIYTGFLCLVFQSLQWLTAFNYFRLETWRRFCTSRDQYYKWFLHGMEKAAEDFALSLPSDIDGRALIRTLETLDEDEELEAFFEGIPGFCNSAVVSSPLAAFKTPNGEKISEALVGFMHNTLSSNLVPEPIKHRRIEICINAVKAASLSIDGQIFDRVLNKDWGGLSNSVEFGFFLKRIPYCDAFSAYYSQCVISVIVATTQERDMRWFKLAKDQLGISHADLRKYLDNGDSLLLAICISISRHTMDAYYKHGWERSVYSRSKTLDVVSEFNIHHTLPGLKREFCALWNELVKLAQSHNNERIPISILKHIRKVYVRLHEDTTHVQGKFFICRADDPYLSFPSSYPSCDISNHHSNTTLHISEAATVTTMEASHGYPSSSLPLPQHDSTPTSTISSTVSDTQAFPRPDNYMAAAFEHSISTHTHSCSPLELLQPLPLVPATSSVTQDYTNESATVISSTVNTTQPPTQIRQSLPFPIPIRDHTHSTNPQNFLPTPVCRLDCSQQNHSRVICFPLPPITQPSLTSSRASFVPSSSVGPAAAGGVNRDARDLRFPSLTESPQHLQQVVPSEPFPHEAHRDAKLLAEDDVISENPACSQERGISTGKQS